MWKSIASQQEICPSSLTSRACLSHRRRPSTSSSAASTQDDAPSNRWSISHGDRSSEVCLCGLFSLMRSASSVCPPHPVSPVLRGRAQKRRRLEEASTQSTHTTLTDIKRPQAIPQAIAVYYKYLVYQELSGMSVSRGTLCLTAPPYPRGLGDVSVGCGTPGQKRWEGELAPTGSVKTTIHSTRRRGRAPEHLVPERTDYRACF